MLGESEDVVFWQVVTRLAIIVYCHFGQEMGNYVHYKTIVVGVQLLVYGKAMQNHDRVSRGYLSRLLSIVRSFSNGRYVCP